jgi:D-tyrosyl-tRNA(Tyr) deacylase
MNMFLISTSRKDIASMNILHHLLKLRRWKEIAMEILERWLEC